MINGGQDSQLFDKSDDGTTNGDKDLAHDDVADVLVRLAEVDHQTLSEDVDRNSDEKQPLEVTGVANGIADDEEEETRDHRKCAVDITGLGDFEVTDSLQERGEVRCPAVIRHLVSRIEKAGE